MFIENHNYTKWFYDSLSGTSEFIHSPRNPNEDTNILTSEVQSCGSIKVDHSLGIPLLLST